MRAVSFFLFIFLLVFPTMLSAEYHYISVTKTKEKNKLWLIKATLNDIELDMSFSKTKTAYLVYTGPFKSNLSAQRALKKVKRFFPAAYIIEPKEDQNENAAQNSLELNDSNETMCENNATENTLLSAQPDTNTTQTSKVKTQIKRSVKSCAATIPEKYKKSKPIAFPSKNKEKEKVKKIEEKEENVENKSDSHLFIGASLGYSFIPAKNVVNTGSVTVNLPSKHAYSYSIEGGYYYKKDLFFTLNYQKSISKNVDIANIYASVNYKLFTYEEVSPYIGMLGGYSTLEWKTDPINSTLSSSITSTSPLIGTQIGILYSEFDYMSLYVQYQYILMNHSTDITVFTGTSDMQHNSLHNISLGMHFNF